MNKIPRRQFIRNSLMATAAFKAWPLLGQSSAQSRVIGANDDIRCAVVGFNGRGKSHIEAFSAMKGVRLVALCDVDSAVLGKELQKATDAGEKIEGYTDASGRPTTVKAMDTNGVTGLYRSSEGKTGDAVWATRGRWTMLTGKVNQEDITLVMLDNPLNVGFPTYWHARGYGLFAVNPLGQGVFSNGKETLNFTIQPKQSATFRYRLVILEGAATTNQVETLYHQFVDEVK